MDNAAKALIAAGGVLIAMLVITLSMYLVEMFRSGYEMNSQTLRARQVNEFNSHFTKYGNTITGVDVYNILGKVKEVNNDYDAIIDHIQTLGVVNEDNYMKYFYFTEKVMNSFTYNYYFNGEGIVNKIEITSI